MLKKRTSLDWYKYHLNKALDSAELAVLQKHSTYIAKLEGICTTTHQMYVAAQNAEPTTSRMLSLLGANSRYRLEVVQARHKDLQVASRALSDALSRRAREVDEARSRAYDEFLAARAVRQEEAQARAERAVVREQKRRIRYLEESPSLRSAARALKVLLIKESAFEGDMVNCEYCGIAIAAGETHLEHKRPLSRGGDNRRANLALSCGPCNLRKGRKTHAEYLRILGRSIDS